MRIVIRKVYLYNQSLLTESELADLEDMVGPVSRGLLHTAYRMEIGSMYYILSEHHMSMLKAGVHLFDLLMLLIKKTNETKANRIH